MKLKNTISSKKPKFSQSHKTFLRVSSMKIAFQMRFVEAKRKLSMCSFFEAVFNDVKDLNDINDDFVLKKCLISL